MTRSNTTKRRRGSIISALVIIVVMALYFGLALLPALTDIMPWQVSIPLAVLYGGVALAVIAGVLAALRQRMRELASGEEDEAAQY